MKVRPLGAKLFHADRWTDMMKLIVTFHNFSNEPKNYPSTAGFTSSYSMLGNKVILDLKACCKSFEAINKYFCKI